LRHQVQVGKQKFTATELPILRAKNVNQGRWRSPLQADVMFSQHLHRGILMLPAYSSEYRQTSQNPTTEGAVSSGLFCTRIYQ